MQPMREKKQHQPTQSKGKPVTAPSNPPGGHHQRSVSDYIQHQQFQNEQQQSKLLKFLNGNGDTFVENVVTSEVT